MEKLKEYLNNKSILLICNGPNSEWIDSWDDYDVVIKLNKGIRKPGPCHIWVCNGSLGVWKMPASNYEWDWFVNLRRKIPSYEAFGLNPKKDNIVEMKENKKGLSNPFTGTLALIWLQRFKYKSLDIVGMQFFHDGKQLPSGHPEMGRYTEEGIGIDPVMHHNIEQDKQFCTSLINKDERIKWIDEEWGNRKRKLSLENWDQYKKKWGYGK